MQNLIKDFKKLLGDEINRYDEHSIYNSQLFALWLYSQSFSVNRIVESGTYMGSSSRRLRKIFPDVEIFSYEYDKAHFIRAEHSKGVKYVLGELKNNLPFALSKENTVVVIDGPKRKLATRLARQCIKRGALFVAIHDMYEYIPYLKEKFESVIHTGSPSDDEKALDKAIKDVPIHDGFYGTTLAIVEGNKA